MSVDIADIVRAAIVRAADDQPGQGQFLGVDWGAFVVVFLVAFAATVLIVCFYAIGLRLLAAGAPMDGSDQRQTSQSAGAVSVHRPPLALAAAVLCFAVCVAAVLYGIWLIIPQFH